MTSLMVAACTPGKLTNEIVVAIILMKSLNVVAAALAPVEVSDVAVACIPDVVTDTISTYSA